MLKITFMGAGSTVFAKNVLGDCLVSPDRSLRPILWLTAWQDCRYSFKSVFLSSCVRIPSHSGRLYSQSAFALCIFLYSSFHMIDPDRRLLPTCRPRAKIGYCTPLPAQEPVLLFRLLLQLLP